MPEHVHVLLSEPQQDTLADALKSLKQGVSRRLISKSTTDAPIEPDVRLSRNVQSSEDQTGGPFKPSFGLSGDFQMRTAPPPHVALRNPHFWQKRYYDFNIRNYPQFVEKLRYIHRNPVRAGLCERPEDWHWSSFRHYATGCEGRVEIESEWTARKRERAAGRPCPGAELPHSSQNRA